jgi:hypothetical protein
MLCSEPRKNYKVLHSKFSVRIFWFHMIDYTGVAQKWNVRSRRPYCSLPHRHIRVKKNMLMRVGFEPTPFRTSESGRLRREQP